MARQVGTVLGVAGLVAILARLSPADPLETYRHDLVLIIGFLRRRRGGSRRSC